jgi:hypothetical protein
MRIARIAFLMVSGCAGAEPCTDDAHCKLGRVCYLGDCVAEKPFKGGVTYNIVPGDVCEDEGALMCATASSVIIFCRKGRWDQVFECPISEPICLAYRFDDAVVCGDTPYAFGGARCAHEGAAACSFDRRNIYVCSGDEWEARVECATARHCAVYEELYVDCI